MPARLRNEGVLTFTIRDGTIVARVEERVVFGAGSTGTFRSQGTVLRGTGRYSDASGVLSGRGLVEFDASGAPTAKGLTFTIRLTGA